MGILAVPSEEFDRIDIVQVTEEGRVCPGGQRLMPGYHHGLLDDWLNFQLSGGFDFVYPPASIYGPNSRYRSNDRNDRDSRARCQLRARAYMPLAPSTGKAARSR